MHAQFDAQFSCAHLIVVWGKGQENIEGLFGRGAVFCYEFIHFVRKILCQSYLFSYQFGPVTWQCCIYVYLVPHAETK